ncbi:MAG: hypothetical protein WC050_03610 [Candidatus Paceibacterota bacterium]
MAATAGQTKADARDDVSRQTKDPTETTVLSGIRENDEWRKVVAMRWHKGLVDIDMPARA